MRLGLEAGEHTFAFAKEYGIRGVTIGLDLCQIGAFGDNPLGPDSGGYGSAIRAIEVAATLPERPVVVVPTASYAASVFTGTDWRNR